RGRRGRPRREPRVNALPDPQRGDHVSRHAPLRSRAAARAVSLSVALAVSVAGRAGVGPRPPLDAGRLRLALDRLLVVGGALYVAAHPDDEDTALLAWLAQGRGVRTAYLSLTRGDGGQNLVGSEQGEALGLLRTRELLAARDVDGAEQWF